MSGVPSMRRPVVGIVVVNWNGERDTIRCLRSLTAVDEPALSIVVVDNGSRTESVAAIESAYPEVPILRHATNLGFAGGANAGMRHLFADGLDFALLVNNDAVLAPDAVAALLDAAAVHPRAALLAPKLCMLEQRDVILSAGGELPADGRPTLRGLGERDRGQFDSPRASDWLSGAVLMVRRGAAEEIGLLDEQLFAYFEDADWCLRAQAAGYETLYVPGAVAWHPDTRLRPDPTGRVQYYMARNQLRLIVKHRLGVRALLQVLGGQARTLTSFTLRPKWRHKRRQRNALARAVWDFARGRGGPAPAGWS